MPSSKDPNQTVQPGSGQGGSGDGSIVAYDTLPIYGGGPDWADGTTNPATSVNGQLTKIIVDLASLSGGSAKIGSDALVGASDTIAAGPLYNQLGLLKQASHIEYGGGVSWLDGTTNPATTVEGQLDKILTNLTHVNGSMRIGSPAVIGSFVTLPGGTINLQIALLKQGDYIEGADIVGATNTIPANTLFAQLAALKQSSNIEYAGGSAWVDGTTNPATVVESQLDKIITDLTNQTGSSSGAHRLGTASIPGTSGTIAAGSIYAALLALKSSSNLEYAGGGAWANGVTNPATSVELQLDKVISDLSSTTLNQSGVRKIGAEEITGLASFIPAGTLYSQLVALKSAYTMDVEARNVWLGGRTNPDSDVFTAFNNIINDVSDQTTNDDGMKRVGGQAVAGSPNSLSLGSARSQVNQLLGFVNTNANAITTLTTTVTNKIAIFQANFDDGDGSPGAPFTFSSSSYTEGTTLNVYDALTGDVVVVTATFLCIGPFGMVARLRLQAITGYGTVSPSSQGNISGAVANITQDASSTYHRVTLQGVVPVDRDGAVRIIVVGKAASSSLDVNDYSIIAIRYR